MRQLDRARHVAAAHQHVAAARKHIGDEFVDAVGSLVTLAENEQRKVGADQRHRAVADLGGAERLGMNLTDSEYYAYANTQRLPRGVYRTGRRALASVNVNF